jgi:hypothetical protein
MHMADLPVIEQAPAIAPTYASQGSPTNPDKPPFWNRSHRFETRKLEFRYLVTAWRMDPVTPMDFLQPNRDVRAAPPSIRNLPGPLTHSLVTV